MKKTVTIDGYNLSIEDLVFVARHYGEVKIHKKAIEKINKSRAFLEHVVNNKKAVYGVNTGFGAFENVVIKQEDIEKLQVNLIRSHAVGVGEPLSEEAVRAIILARINSLIRGNSGIRYEVIEGLLGLLNKRIYPFVPSKGSVGSSGDLAPLSHIMLVLIGEGEVFVDGKLLKTSENLERLKIEPVRLSYKEGLALNNGTAVMTGIGALNVYDGETLCKSADIIAAMSTEALMGTNTSFKPQIHKVRPHRGQGISAENLYKCSKDSEIMLSHKDCIKVQDSYSLRCIPQVHGAVKDTVNYVKGIITTELNSSTDNPLIFYEDELICSGGNFHGEPVALGMDFLSIAISELGNISERRTAKLLDSKNSQGLPMFLVDANMEGLNSGLMIVQYTSASLVSENKVLSHPSSVDSIPTSANQEDHVSMGTIGARKAGSIINNVTDIMAIELMCASQALDFKKPLKGGKATDTVHKYIRKSLKHVSHDRVMYKEIYELSGLIRKGEIINVAEEAVGKLG